MKKGSISKLICQIGRFGLVICIIGGFLLYIGFADRWITVRHSHEEPIEYTTYSPNATLGTYVTFTINSYLLAFESGKTTKNRFRSGQTNVTSYQHSNHVYLLARDMEGNDLVLDWSYGYSEYGVDRLYPVVKPNSDKMFSFVIHEFPNVGDEGIQLSGVVKQCDMEGQQYLSTWGNHFDQKLTSSDIQSIMQKMDGKRIIALYLDGDAPQTVTVREPDTYVWNENSVYFMLFGGLFIILGLGTFIARKLVLSKQIKEKSVKSLNMENLNNTINMNNSSAKEEIFKILLKATAQKSPSEQFASGAVFDISRQHHEDFEQVLHSGNATALRKYFADAYAEFLANPGVVGFTPDMINPNKNDTNPNTWNADVFSFPDGNYIALLFMPVQSTTFEARIVGIVSACQGDGYYYCMLNKDNELPSDVYRNKAWSGIEKVGEVKGRGFELISSFLNCIKDNYAGN